MPKLTKEQENVVQGILKEMAEKGVVPMFDNDKVAAAADYVSEDGSRLGRVIDIFQNNPDLTAYLLAWMIVKAGGEVTFTHDELKSINDCTMAMVGDPYGDSQEFSVVVKKPGEAIPAIDGTSMVQK
jgi:hypothetical protein